MIATEPRSPFDLMERTRTRNVSVWVGLLTGTPIAEDEVRLNTLHRDMVESYLDLINEVFQVKEYERNRSVVQSQAEVDQERFLASAKAETERAKMATKIAADDYLFAARVYDAQVRAIVMAAREYAGQVEAEQTRAEAQRLELGVEKEAIHLHEVNAKIYYEEIQKAMVQVDLAKNQLEVAKAGVRAVMADIEARKSELGVIEAEVQEAMAVVEKATLQADVAMILAEVVTKQLSQVKLAVDQEEITQGFDFIKTKLSDLLSLWSVRDRVEALKAQGAQNIIEETLRLLAAEEVDRDLRLTEVQNAGEVLGYEKDQTATEIIGERTQRQAVLSARKNLLNTENSSKIQILNLRTWAEQIVNAARRSVSANRTVTRYNMDIEALQIRGN